MNAREAMRRGTGRALAEAGNQAAPESAEDFRHTDAVAFEQVEEFDQANAEASLGDAMAQAVYDRRLELGWSKAELARRAGMNERVIRRLEDGGRPVTGPTLMRLGTALGGSFAVELRGSSPTVIFEPAQVRRAAAEALRIAAAALLNAGFPPEQTRILLRLSKSEFPHVDSAEATTAHRVNADEPRPHHRHTATPQGRTIHTIGADT
ncbi:helix-turn-helix domain-containing protein [Uniformispora flossi]|uniref:helix-turn-helix domain-containing protein n=1 Tax=Uniformispora flossi TaxID=3390723 RepID=UPI003C2FE4C5